MKIFKKTFTAFLICLTFLLLFVSCSDKKTDESAQLPDYPGWITYSKGHFIFHFRANVSWADRIDELSQTFERVLADDCAFLGMEIPKEIIHVYIYNSPGEAGELCGKKPPYIIDNQIHWEKAFTPYGVGVAMYLVDRMGIPRTKYDFLYDGLITLRDHSKNDYHHLTASHFGTSQYIPLDSLINKESYFRAHERHRKYEAASIVAFITYNYGVAPLKELWKSKGSFEESIKSLFNMDLKSFEQLWNDFARERFKGVERETIYFKSNSTK